VTRSIETDKATAFIFHPFTSPRAPSSSSLVVEKNRAFFMAWQASPLLKDSGALLIRVGQLLFVSMVQSPSCFADKLSVAQSRSKKKLKLGFLRCNIADNLSAIQDVDCAQHAKRARWLTWASPTPANPPHLTTDQRNCRNDWLCPPHSRRHIRPAS